MRVLVLSFKPVAELYEPLLQTLACEREFPVQTVVRHWTLSQCQAGEASLNRLLAEELPDLAVLCWPLNLNGHRESVLRLREQLYSELPLVMAFSGCDTEEIRDVMHGGASDYVTAPFHPEDVLPRLWQLYRDWQHEDPLIQHLREQCGLSSFVGNSPSLLAELNKIPAIARCDVNVLIDGETGTGKEICARSIHKLSPRLNKPFIAVNSGAIPEELMENELFGHQSGAFTSAATSRPGVIREADGGTLFLDEVECLPLKAQAKLLRFLQEKEFKPLGESRVQHADVRVLAACNIKLEEAIRTGHFRRDLYYRLKVIHLTMPPLRDRKEDIPLLARHFLSKYCQKFKFSIKGFTGAAMQKMIHYEWPGNVRELENMIESAVLLAKGGVLRPEDIRLPMHESSVANLSFKESKAKMVAEFEKAFLAEKLRSCDGNVTRAALASRQHPRAFRRLLRKHRIQFSS